MEQSQFSLSWDAHKKNICNGLSSLQQNGEFVDMTLAADGHMVKVHQVIIALSSPYIKDLIASAQCPHPIVFLNKISYATLSALLEYIYTGEVLVSVENLNELIEAAKELHIKGLEDMRLHQSTSVERQMLYKVEDQRMEEEEIYFEITNPKQNERKSQSSYIQPPDETNRPDGDGDGDDPDHSAMEGLAGFDDEMQGELTVQEHATETELTTFEVVTKLEEKPDSVAPSVMQYTISNQGSIQMILNRFVYFLKHTNRDNSRQWRCVDYLNTLRCPALVVTKGDMVQHRLHSHTHGFHDKRILKKVQDKAVFTAIQEAVTEGNICKKKGKGTVVASSKSGLDNSTVPVPGDTEE